MARPRISSDGDNLRLCKAKSDGNTVEYFLGLQRSTGGDWPVRIIKSLRYGSPTNITADFLCEELLFVVYLNDCLCGALSLAGTAGQALLMVDLEMRLALVNSLSGALLCAGAAGQTLFSNNKCHCIYLHFVIKQLTCTLHCTTEIQKCKCNFSLCIYFFGFLAIIPYAAAQFRQFWH